MTFETSPRDPSQVISLEGAKNLQPGVKRATATIFRDPVSQLLRADLDRIAPSDASVLIVGETGTGKELVSRYIHAQSRRRGAPFVAINCGAFSETMSETELFGFEKGAFTGASRTQPGWFEAAQGGTLLLDEIGDLPLILQVKLLRVLQEREVVRVGSRKPLAVDVRVIAATNVDLEAAVRHRRFREDLYFRLNVASVRLAPLRERPGDIEPLARHFLDVFRLKLNRPDLSFSRDAIQRLVQCAWPGNIRQLENTIQNAAILVKRSVIGADDIRLQSTAIPRNAPVATLEDAVRLVVERAVAEREADIFDRILRGAVHTAFEMTSGNQLRATEATGLSRNAFRTHLGRIGAIPPRRRTPLRADTGAPTLAVVRSTANPVDLNIGVQKYGTSSILKVFGFVRQRLAPRGFNVTWTEFPSGPQLLQALGRNDVAFVATGDAPPIFGQAAGIPLVYVGHDPAAPDGEALVVRRGSTIHRDQRQQLAGMAGIRSAEQMIMLASIPRQGMHTSRFRLCYYTP
jgi:DNA-binding NtrC family response regulator